MGRKRDELGGKVEVAKLGKNQALPSPIDDKHYLIPQAEFVLIPLLATDPLPYLLNQAGEPIDVDGRPLRDRDENGISPTIRQLQEEADSESLPS